MGRIFPVGARRRTVSSYRPYLEMLDQRETPALLALGLGGTGNDLGTSVATDAAGNVYVSGKFQGTADFDPGAGVSNLTSAGNDDIFVAKFTSAGGLVWAQSMGGTGLDNGFGLAVDTSANVYLTGSYSSTVDFDPGAGSFNLTSAGGTDVFIVKLDTGGNFVWARSMGGSGNDSGGGSLFVDHFGNGITVDSLDNVCVVGLYQGTADFDPGLGTFSMTSVSGSQDGFVTKLDNSGNFLWAASLGGGAIDIAINVVTDSAGNLFASGLMQGTADFDPGAGTFNLSTFGGYDAYICKLDPVGNFLGAGHLGGSSGEGGYAIAIDVAGNIYSTGSLGSVPTDVDFGPGTTNINTLGSDDVFVVKMDNALNFQWARTMGGTSSDYGRGIAITPAGNIVTTGIFRGPADFDPGAGTFTLNSAGSSDIFVSMLDSAGNFVAAWGMGGTGLEQGHAIAVDASGGIYTTGPFSNTVDFDPGPGVLNRTSAGSSDIFLSKIGTGLTIVEMGGSTSLNEGGANDTYTVVLDDIPTANVIVTLTPDTQLTQSAATLTFTPLDWNTAQTVTVTAVDDAAVEGNHTGVLSFTTSSADTNFNALTVASVTAQITDNDGGTAGITITPSAGSTTIAEGGATDTYTVVLTSAPTANVTITLTSDAQVTASTTLTFTPLNWNVAQTVTVTAVDDFVFELLQTGVITHSATSADAAYNGLTIPSLTATITDNDLAGLLSTNFISVTEGGTTAPYSITLSSQPTTNVVVTITTGTQVTLSATTLTFTPANWNVGQNVTVTAVDDLLAEGLHAGVITNVSSSSDANYSGVTALVTANITDNDAAGISVVPSGGATSVAEGGATDTYQVVLASPPTANVVVTVNPGVFLSAAPTPLTFTPASWNVAQTVTVTAIDDAIFQGPHTGVIAHTSTSADAMYNGLAVASVTANIADNDALPGVLVSGVVDLVEGGAASYTIVLQTLPAANVVINLATDPQLTFAASSLTFTPANWNAPQTVAVSCAEDMTVEPDQTLAITHSIATTDPGYSALSIANVSAYLVDNDGTLVQGTSEKDNILVNFVSGKVQAIVNGVSTYLKGPITRIVVLAQAGDDFVQITAPTVPVVVVGGSGTDAVWTVGKAGLNTFLLDGTLVTVNGQAVSVGEAESMVLGGRTGNDTFRVQNLPAIPVEFKGDRGNDYLFGPNSTNTWNITDTSGGSLNGSLTINGIENWIGGTGDDTFRFGDRKSIAGKLDGGGGINDVDYSASTTPVSVNLQTSVASGAKVVANIQSFLGGPAIDKLIGRNQANTWTLSGPNAGDVNGIDFTSFENLTGGTLADTFALADGVGISGVIDGAAGKDVLDYSSYLASVAVDMQAKKATNTGGILNLEQFRGGTGLADTLIGLNKTNRWIVSGAGAGTLNNELFANFENLTGGTLADTFNLAAAGDWLGTLSGGSGKDSLFAFTGRSNVWSNGATGAGTLNGRAFVSIETRR